MLTRNPQVGGPAPTSTRAPPPTRWRSATSRQRTWGSPSSRRRSSPPVPHERLPFDCAYWQETVGPPLGLDPPVRPASGVHPPYQRQRPDDLRILWRHLLNLSPLTFPVKALIGFCAGLCLSDVRADAPGKATHQVPVSGARSVLGSASINKREKATSYSSAVLP